MTNLAYVNGEITPLEEAKISILDRGFLFGDGVYEVLLSYNGRLWAVERHNRRLERSLREIDIDNFDVADSDEATAQLLAQSALSDAMIYIQVTRGQAPKRSHTYPQQLKPSLVVTVTPFKSPTDEQREKGAALLSCEDLRWRRCDIKSVNLLPNCMARQQALEAGCFEALLVRDGMVTECGASSPFMVKDGVIAITPLAPEILPSVTREIVIESVEEMNLPIVFESRPLEDYYQADEVFLAGTTTEVMPICRIDEHPIPVVGEITRRLSDDFQQRLREHRD